MVIKSKKCMCLVAFVCGAISMIMVLGASGLLGGGGDTLISGDLGDIYIPAIRNLVRDIKSGQDIYFTWTYGLGSNTAMYNAYYAMSPLNIIYYLTYNCNMNNVTVFIIVVKTGLAASAFYLFVSRIHGVKDIIAIIFAVFYSMCSYQVVYNTINIMWLDAMFMTPLIFMLVVDFIKDSKYGKWLILSYAYIFISQFYMGFIIGILSAVYLTLWLLLLTEYDRKSIIRKMVTFVEYVIIAICISAFVWMPAICSVMGDKSTMTGLEYFDSLRLKLLDVINQLFFGEDTGVKGLFPYIYCGLLSTLMLPVFFANKNIKKHYKSVYGGLLVILVVACIFKPIYALFHAFNAPDFFAFRFAYLASFVLCVIATITLEEIDTIKTIWLPISAFAALIVYIVEIFYQQKRIEDTYCSNNWEMCAINGALLLIWVALALLLKYGKCNKNIVLLIMLCIAVCEVTGNGVEVFKIDERDGRRLEIANFDIFDECHDYVVDALSADEDLYRVASYQEIGAGVGTYYGYNNVSYFSSSENINLRKALSKLGIWSSERILLPHGLNGATVMLLGIRYDIYSAKKMENCYTVEIIPNDYELGLGFMVDEFADDILTQGNAFESINILFSEMCGEDIHIFRPFDEDKVNIEENGIQLLGDKEGCYLYWDDNIDEATLTFSTDAEDDVYMWIDNDNPGSKDGDFVYEGGNENFMFYKGNVSVSYIKKMDRYEGGQKITILPRNRKTSSRFNGIYYYTFDRGELEHVYSLLYNGCMEITEYRDGYINADVSVTDGRKLLFTSIPYDKGWKAYINGREVDIRPLLGNAFVGIDIPDNGEWNIRFVYEAPGRQLGIILTVVGALICAGLFYREKKLLTTNN